MMYPDFSEFTPGLNPPETCDEPAWWFVFRDGDLLIAPTARGATLPKARAAEQLGIASVRSQYLGSLAGRPCFSAEADAQQDAPGAWEFAGLRDLFGVLDDALYAVAVKAVQIVRWDRDHQFCGRCGVRTGLRPRERARACPSCGMLFFPRLSPAIIVAVARGDEILLAYNRRYRTRMFSILAGFVEAGETLEQAVAREVAEETSIEIDNIRYFGSQPWPYPNSLMIGFNADYAGGEIRVEPEELREAHWFRYDSLPETLPGKISISRALIDAFVRRHSPNS